ncbi:ovarian cancer G-protein coupled receptor 1-like [Engraulis encrasicolus]|uniref:ovarian cancer G-protein coupled receptor 1-like n=1 Tax=Engraulis encrasicolus TaxID=184585 RepID=UPI002FD506E7
MENLNETINSTFNGTANATAVHQDYVRDAVLTTVSCTMLVIGLPITLIAVYGLCFSIKPDHVAPVYVLNLMISDVAQLFGNALYWAAFKGTYTYALYITGLLASTWFMGCIAVERYTMIAYPVFYRYHRTLKKACLVSATVWMAAIFMVVLCDQVDVVDKYRALPFALPFPLLVFPLFRTWRVLSKSRSVSRQQQRRVLLTLGLVLCTYVVFFLPYIVMDLLILCIRHTQALQHLHMFTEVFMSLNPLLDPVFYVFMRRDAKDIFLAFPWLRRFRKCREMLETNTTDDTTVSGAGAQPSIKSRKQLRDPSKDEMIQAPQTQIIDLDN